MTTFRWLHVTDLHEGQRGQHWLYPEVEEVFLADLDEQLQAVGGPLDLVLFTGDLTQKGTQAEFQALEARLLALHHRLARKGSTPFWLAVPGNHDLQRPSRINAYMRMFTERGPLDATRQEMWHSFWEEAQSPYRAMVVEAFAAWSDWWSRTALPRPLSLRQGLLPGEWTVTLARDQVRLGIMGLNSAYRQLSEADFEGQLVLDRRQFHSAGQLAEPSAGRRPPDGIAWCQAHHLNLLLTHHPPAWLDGPSREVMAGVIRGQNRVGLHLYGHMHQGDSVISGSWTTGPSHAWQGHSLFGLEMGHQGHIERQHGYAIGVVDFAPEQATLRIWPRRAEQHAGTWYISGLTPALQRGRLHSPPISLPLLRPLGPPEEQSTDPLRPVRPASPRSAPPTETAPYRPDYYVARRHSEGVLADRLAHPGQPLQLFAPDRFGKSFLIGAMLDPSGPHCSPADCVVYLDIHGMDAEAQTQRDIFYRTICGRIAQRRASTHAGYEELARWFDQRPASQDAWERFRDLLQDHILPDLPEGGRLILVFDKVDRLPEPDGLEEASMAGGPRYPLRRSRFLERLRSLSQEAEAPWDQLRIVVTAQTPPRFWWGAAGSAAVVASASELRGFDQAECEEL